jgi:hypothetical protein
MSDKTTIQSIQGEYRDSITGQNEQEIIVSKLVLIQLPKKGHSEDSASTRQILTLMALAPTMHTVSLHSSITFHIWPIHTGAAASMMHTVMLGREMPCRTEMLMFQTCVILDPRVSSLEHHFSHRTDRSTAPLLETF